METRPKFAFLKSVRFWVMVGGIASLYLQAKGWIGTAERDAIASFSALFLTVGTVDRYADKKVEAAEVAGGSNIIND